MALIVVTRLDFTATKVTLVDATGNYNVTSNPTGYGSPNAAFTDFGHYALIRKKNVNSVADSLLTMDATNPITDTQFPATRSVDGWYEGVKFNITIWSAGTYPTGTVRLRSGVIYIALTSTSNAPPHADWATVTDLETIENNATVTVTTTEEATPYNADVYWSKKVTEYAQLGLDTIPPDDRQKARLDNIYRNIQVVLLSTNAALYDDAEWAVIRLQRLGAQ